MARVCARFREIRAYGGPSACNRSGLALTFIQTEVGCVTLIRVPPLCGMILNQEHSGSLGLLRGVAVANYSIHSSNTMG